MRINYLVTDYDDCAYHAASPRPDKLSQPVVDMAKAGNYAGFYACTHRNYWSVGFCQFEAMYVAGSRAFYEPFRVWQNFPTYVITPQFAKATDLPNMAVSTMDDLAYDRCGQGYRTVLKPYEQHWQYAGDKPHLSLWDTLANSGSKNHQLLQIALDARKRHPDDEIVLDYVDDLAGLCQNATQAMLQKAWPAGVYLNVYRFVKSEIKPVYLTAVDNAGRNKPSLQTNSMFSPAANSSAMATTKTENTLPFNSLS